MNQKKKVTNGANDGAEDDEDDDEDEEDDDDEEEEEEDESKQEETKRNKSKPSATEAKDRTNSLIAAALGKRSAAKERGTQVQPAENDPRRASSKLPRGNLPLVSVSFMVKNGAVGIQVAPV